MGGVDGDARVYPEPVRIDRASGRIVVRDESQDESWYRRLFTHAPSSGSDLRLVTTRTYNRVEGLPILLGPRLRLAFSWGLVTVDAMGILRSADRFELRSENLGHQLRAEVEAGGPYRLRLGVRNEDLVQSPESWHLSDSEVGIASFILHRDYRDYYNSHGKAVTLGASMRDHLDASVEYADEHWGPLTARDPWSLLRDNQHWRPNPLMDDGHFHLIRAGLTFDNRNDRRDPWSGWYVSGEYEYGSGWITSYAPSTAGVRDVNPTGRTVYDRAFIDVRRYNRLSAEGQLNLRLVAGGWLSGDELPLERRFPSGAPARCRVTTSGRCCLVWIACPVREPVTATRWGHRDHRTARPRSVSGSCSARSSIAARSAPGSSGSSARSGDAGASGGVAARSGSCSPMRAAVGSSGTGSASCSTAPGRCRRSPRSGRTSASGFASTTSACTSPSR